jgi:AmmeMemoRadiSam system protein B
VWARLFNGKDELIREIERCFKHRVGPGSLPGKCGKTNRIRGLVSPHAGYVYSGPVAAHGFKALAEDRERPDKIIILGPNHHGIGSGVAIGTEDFSMPMGLARVDTTLANALAKGAIDKDILAHKYEHSIEVQLPFLQYIYGDVSFVPICMMIQDYEISREVGRIIRETPEARGAVIIASTDLSHYIPKERAAELDSIAIKDIERGDARGLAKHLEEYNISMCGYGPVMVALEALNPRGKCLKYATSGDIEPMRDVVGYASIVLY